MVRMIRLGILVSALVAAATLIVSGHAQERRDPTKDQCTCLTLERGQVRAYYAQVDASLCVNREQEGREPYCRVTIHCLNDGVSGPNCNLNPNRIPLDEDDPASDLSERVAELISEHNEQTGSTMPVQPLVDHLNEMRQYVQQCLDAYIRRAPFDYFGTQPFEQLSDLQVACLPSGTSRRLILVDPTQDGDVFIGIQFLE